MQTTWKEANHQNKFLIDKTGCKTRQCFLKLSAQKIVESLYPEWSYDHETSLPVKDVHTAALVVIDGKRTTTKMLIFFMSIFRNMVPRQKIVHHYHNSFLTVLVEIANRIILPTYPKKKSRGLLYRWVPGYVLPDVPMNTWQKGKAHLVDVPVMIGKYE